LNTRFTEKIKIGSSKWEMEIYISDNFVKVNLKSLDVIDNTYSHFYAKVVVYIRNVYNYNCSRYKETQFLTYDNFSSAKEFSLITLTSLYTKDYLIENNECIIGAYIRLYDYGKVNFIEDIRRKDENYIDTKEDFFEWTLDIFEVLDSKLSNLRCIIDKKEYILTINAVTVNSSVYLLNIYISSSNPKFIETYRNCRDILYIRKCSGYSCYNY